MNRTTLTLIALVICISSFVQAEPFHLSLNGTWEIGQDQDYRSKVEVPSIATDPAKLNDGKLWYRRKVKLPNGSWKQATLLLMGARFKPEVYVNGKLVSTANGGMAATWHLLRNKDVVPGKEIALEVALTSLRDLSDQDASYIPIVDQWRSNCSSSLWDDVDLLFHDEFRIGQIIPRYDRNKKIMNIEFNTIGESDGNKDYSYSIRVKNSENMVLLSKQGSFVDGGISTAIHYGNKLSSWTPDSPNLYSLTIEVMHGKRIVDRRTIKIGIKEFTEKGKQFYLNGSPCKIRGGTVVWHRWVRSPEGRELGYNEVWFAENIITRLKEHGANLLRFHLGVPPRRLLNLCDSLGILVQYEWSFFHGMPASYESLMEQYPVWFNNAMLHPSIALYHPYNETEEKELKTVWRALNQIVKNYPPIVLEDRDVIHIHKYWWSLFENLGLYYDSADQFNKAIMVDEFGGNYLDEKGELGGYRSLKESYLRFLGRENTTKERLEFQALSNGKVAEYWRRIGAAGVAPFTITSSYEDGNTWFMGPLKDGNPKPVWNALTPVYSPQAISLNVWDRNYTPGQEVKIPLHLFNDTHNKATLQTRIWIEDSSNKLYFEQFSNQTLSPYSQGCIDILMQLPKKEGRYRMSAELLNRPSSVLYPIISSWDMHIFQAVIPEAVSKSVVAVADGEYEIKTLLRKNDISIQPVDHKEVSLLITSSVTWNKIKEGDLKTKKMIEQAIDKGISVLMLSIGEQELGQGYPKVEGDLGPLQAVARVSQPRVSRYTLFEGVELVCIEAAEPESHLHRALDNNKLWSNIPKEYTWLWNGMRGGLIVPASDIEITGLSQQAFLEVWRTRGANIEKIKSGNYYAYDLQGFHKFSEVKEDKKTQELLRSDVVFLIQDAPALASSINPNTPIRVTNLHEEYLASEQGRATQIKVLATAGKNLTRTPVIEIEFGDKKGKLILSQLLTEGRLDSTKKEGGLYDIRYDEVAIQYLFNMMDLLLTER